MAASTITPSSPNAAPAAASPATSAPASTPPAGGAAPAAGSATPGGSGAGATPATPNLDAMEPAARLAHVMRERLKEAKPGEGIDIDEPAKPFQEFGDFSQELPMLNGDQATDPTETQPQAKAETTEQTATEASADDPLLTDQPYALPDTITPKDLASALEAKPELKAALDADPALKAKVFANARRSEKLAQIEQYVRSPEDAKVLHETAGIYNNLSDMMGSIQKGNLQTVGDFLGTLVNQTILRDESGQPLLDQNGRPMTDGSVFRMASGLYELRHHNLRELYEKEGNDEGVAAIDLLNRLQGIGASPASSASEQEMPEHLRARAADLDAREKSLNERTKAAKEGEIQSFNRSVALRRAEMFETELAKVMNAATGLGDFNRDAAQAKIKDALKTFLRTDHAYNRELKQLEAAPRTEATANKLVETAVRAMRNNLARLANPILTEAGAQAMTQQANLALNHDARAKASRGDGGATATQAPTAPTKLEGRALNEHLVAEFVKTNSRQPSNEEIIAAAARYRLNAGRNR